jgi:ABC-2 type transport system permease protein
VRGFAVALGCELLKARRSWVPLVTALGFALAPLAGGVFMIIIKDPERARSMGLIGAKAQIVAGAADWPTYLGFLAQAVAVGGLFVFALVAAWVFGREFADRTVKQLLAVPTARAAVVAAKLALVAAWCGALSVWVFGLGLAVGALVGLSGGSGPLVMGAAAHVAVTALQTIALMTPITFLASAGRGYLPPLGFALLTVFLAQVLAALGWGAWFPWSVPALYSGLGGASVEPLGFTSVVVVAITSLAGAVATFAWWELADQTT